MIPDNSVLESKIEVKGLEREQPLLGEISREKERNRGFGA